MPKSVILLSTMPNAQRLKERGGNDQPPPRFPPLEKDRKHKLSEYGPKDCTHCKREDADPKRCKHRSDTCFRRPGGECDQANAKTRGQRNAVCRRLAIERQRNGPPTKNGDKKKTNHSAVRVMHAATRVAVTPTAPNETTTVAPKEPKATEGAAPPPSVDKHKKIRSRKYTKSKYAQDKPMTEAELDFAIRECPNFVNKGHIRHQPR